MSDFLDKALGLVSGIQQQRVESRNDLMRTLLPEVLQPEELKEAEAKPMKEEGPKTLHAPKYDRRMKFNTALERSKHEASKEEPAWLKEAAATNMPKSPARTLGERVGKGLRYAGIGAGILGAGELANLGVQKAVQKVKGQKQAGDAVFDFDGVTGRESTITTEEELERTPPLPIEEPEWYDVPNKPVMQKGASSFYIHKNLGHLKKYGPDATELLKNLGEGQEQSALEGGTRKAYKHLTEGHKKKASTLENETFTQRHPGFLPILLGLGGAAAGAIPGALLGGRSAVKSVQKQYAKNVGQAGRAHGDTVSAFGRASGNPSTPKDVLNDLHRKARQSEEAFAKVIGNQPNEATHRTVGRVGGGMLGGLAGGGTGMLGGLALNDPAVYEF